MAIQDFSSNTPAPQDADPRRTLRAPFPVRAEQEGDQAPLAEDSRGELTTSRHLASERRTVARCPTCGKPVLAGDDYMRDRGDLYHSWCVRH